MKRNNILYMVSGGLLGLTFICGLILSSVRVMADSVVDDVSVMVAESCTLSTPSGAGQVYTVDMQNGQYKNDIGKTRISVFCNTGDSFAVYAIGYSDDTFGNTNMITTSTGATNIATGTATSGNTSNWAMKLETNTSGSYAPTIISPFGDFTSVPSSYTKVAEVSSVTGSITVDSAIDASYAVYIAPGQSAGSYTGKVRYTIVHPNNAAAPIPGITLLESYEKAGKTKVNGYYTLQDMSTAICDAATIPDEASQMQAIDTRDNKIYWITKLQDGKCWMTQNLDLNLDSSVALTNQDTDLNTVASWTPMRSTINAVTNANTSGSVTDWVNDVNTPYSVDSGNWYWKNSPFYNSNLCSSVNLGNRTCDYIAKLNSTYSAFFSTTPYVSNGTHGHVGNYYNFSAAVASNDTSSYTTSTFADVSNNPPNSICPKGWRLPTITSASPDYTQAGSKDEFSRLAYLYANYTGNTAISPENLEKAPLYYPRSGDVNTSALYLAGHSGIGWSSTVSTSTDAYYFGFDSGGIYPQYVYTDARIFGSPIRCVSR
ncbi:hypothetical protein IKF03_02010 [Candidatus Saccharibacteria bacterium]|nr:hypothetical protein [Candidatus Saccharibacteria bacterium]